MRSYLIMSLPEIWNNHIVPYIFVVVSNLSGRQWGQELTLRFHDRRVIP